MNSQCDTCAFNRDTPLCLSYLLGRAWAQIFKYHAAPVDSSCPHYLEQVIDEINELDVSELL